MNLEESVQQLEKELSEFKKLFAKFGLATIYEAKYLHALEGRAYKSTIRNYEEIMDKILEEEDKKNK